MLNTRKMNNPIKKWAEDLNRHFSKDDIQMASRHVERCMTPANYRKTQSYNEILTRFVIEGKE